VYRRVALEKKKWISRFTTKTVQRACPGNCARRDATPPSLHLVQEEGVFDTQKIQKRKKTILKYFVKLKQKKESQTESFSQKNSETIFSKTKLEAIKKRNLHRCVGTARGGNQRSVNDLVLCDTCCVGLSSSK
jgi:hypothetical protein